MVRIKIKVNVAALQQRTKSMNIIIGSGTTALNVITKVLDKYEAKNPPSKFQLCAVTELRGQSHKEQLLDDDEKLSDIIAQESSQSVHFHLKYKPTPPPTLSSLVRVYHQIDQDYETFQSLIITPSMTTKDVVQLVLARISLDESHDESLNLFELALRTASGERRLEDGEHPFQLAGSNSQLILRRRQSPRQPDIFKSSSATTQHFKHIPLSETPQHNFSFDSEPLSVISSSSEVDHPLLPLSEMNLEKGKVQLHSELIEALRALASQLDSGKQSGATPVSKENVLEQAIIEQSQILDVMQDLITSLESENKSFRDKINKQGKTILELATWEAKAKKVERQLSELTSHRYQSPFNVSEYKRALAERDRTIAGLNSQLSISSNTRLVAAQASLESERVRVIELEEDLSAKRDELIKLKEELSSKQSILIAKESEIMHIRHEMKTLKKLEGQQQELVLRQRASLRDKDTQLITLNRALNEEKKLCEQLRKKHFSSTSLLSPRVGDSSHLAGRESPQLTSSLFNQVLGRNITAIEFTKPDAQTEIGMNYSKMDLPISSKVPCLVVKAVKQGSLASGLVRPGDELLEINGILCRGPLLAKATECLHGDKGTIRIVLARDQEPSFENAVHSTPAKPKLGGDDTLWATALSGDDETAYKSSTGPITRLPHSESIPTSHTLSTNTEMGQGGSPSSSTEGISRLDSSHPDTSAYTSLQAEFADLQDQLDESEYTRLELENELNEFHSENEALRMDSDLIKAENFELQQQIVTYEEEISQIRSNIVDLQSPLISLEQQVCDEQQRAASYENQNRLLERESAEMKEKMEFAQSEVDSLQEELKKLRKASLESTDAKSRDQEELTHLRALRNQFQAALTAKEVRIDELTSELDSRESEYESSLSQIKSKVTNLQDELSKLKKVSGEGASSAKVEYDKTLLQLKSAKNLLVEAEQKESEMTIKIRYLKQAADEANKQLAEAEKETENVEAELREFKGEVERLSLNNKSLSIGLKHTQSKLEGKEQMQIRLQNEVDDLRRNAVSLNHEMSQLQTDNNKLQSSINSAESERERLEKKLRGSNSEKDSLFQDLENSIDECTQLQQRLESMAGLTAELEVSKEKEKQLGAQVAELLQQKAAEEEETAKIIKHVRGEKSSLEEELICLRSKSRLHTQTTSQAQEEASQLQHSFQRQKAALESTREENVQLIKKYEELEKKHSEQRNSLERISQSKQVLQKELDETRAASKEIAMELENSKKKVEILKQQLQKSKEEFKASETSLEVSQKELNKSRASCNSLALSKEDSEQKLKNLIETVDSLRVELSQKELSLHELTATCTKLEEELKIEKEHSTKFQSEKLSIQSEAASLQKAAKQSGDLVSSMEFVLQQEKSKFEDVQAILKKKEEEVVAFEGEVEKLNGQLVSLDSEKETFEEKLGALTQQLRASEEGRRQEVSELQDQVETLASEVSTLQKTLQSTETNSSDYRALSSQLQASVEQINKEKEDIQRSLDESLCACKESERESKQLAGQVKRLQSDFSQLEETSNMLSSETANLRKQLRQSERQVDKLSAEVQAAEINLEVANRTMETEQQQFSEHKKAAAYLQDQYKETQDKLEDALITARRNAMELHASQEEKSKLKITAELRQKEATQLQQSLVEAQSAVDKLEAKVSTLQSEKKELSESVNQLQECQKEIQSSLEVSEKEHTQRLRAERETVTRLSKEVEELREKEKAQSDQERRLERSLKEARDNVDQLVAARSALKESLSSLGDEKDVEILRLTKEVSDGNSRYANVTKELNETKEKGASLELRLKEKEELVGSKTQSVEELVKENTRLSQEMGALKATEAEIKELHSKITDLEESLRAKNTKLIETTQRIGELEAKLNSAKEESEEYRGVVSELAQVKLQLVESSIELDQLRKQSGDESKARKELEKERDHLLSTLRKLEVEKHTAVIQPPTPKLPRADGDELDEKKVVVLLKENEEEMRRLQEYVSKLLSNVVEKAPFVLENFS